MATGTAGSAARDYQMQVIHYIRKDITYADHGSTLTIGTIPAGAQIIKAISGVYVNVAFNAVGADTLDIGPSTDIGTDLWATALDCSLIGFVPLDEAVTLVVSSDTIVQCDLTSSGSTAGTGVVVIAYIPSL